MAAVPQSSAPCIYQGCTRDLPAASCSPRCLGAGQRRRSRRPVRDTAVKAAFFGVGAAVALRQERTLDGTVVEHDLETADRAALQQSYDAVPVETEDGWSSPEQLRQVIADLERSWQQQQSPSVTNLANKEPASSLHMPCSGSRDIGARAARLKRLRRSAAAVAAAPTATAAAEQRGSVAPEADQEYLVRLATSLAGSDGGARPQEVSTSNTAMSAYIRNLNRTKLLDQSQELQLAKIVQRGKAVKAVMEALASSLGRQPTADEVVAKLHHKQLDLQLILQNEQAARDLLMRANLRLVFPVAKSYSAIYGGNGMDLIDLVQDGNLGLLKAIDKFDPSKGFRFSTYALAWIRQAIARACHAQSGLLRLPAGTDERVSSIFRARRHLEGNLQRAEPASDAEVGAHAGIPEHKVRDYLKMVQLQAKARSINSAAYQQKRRDDDEDVELAEQITDEASEQELEDAGHWGDVRESLQDKVISDVLNTLPARERNILRMRFGLHLPEAKEMTVSEIAAAYGVSKQRIAQMEQTAVRKLQLTSRRRMLQQCARF